MKRSIKQLPKRTQEELNLLLELITHHIKGCEMIILYGSYARGEYVLWDERIEFGVHTSYQSDLDMLVVISKSNTRITEQRLRNLVAENFHTAFAHRCHASPQFIVEHAQVLNKQLEQRQYFFTDIVKEGIKMYDTQAFKLSKPRELSFVEVRDIAVEEFEKCYPFACEFLEGAKEHYYPKEQYKMGSFMLHQACERFYHTISLVFTNYRPKNHKLQELGAMVKQYARNLVAVFPQNTEFEKCCFDLLCRAYIEARYNKDFAITREEFEYMLERTELLKKITLDSCTAKIASYDDKITVSSVTL